MTKKRGYHFKVRKNKSFIYVSLIFLNMSERKLITLPVSDEWIDLTERISDVSDEIMGLIREKYSAYGGDFIINSNGEKRQVNREDFDLNRKRTITILYGKLANHFDMVSASDLEEAISTMSRLADGYGMNETDLNHYQKLRNQLQQEALPLTPQGNDNARGYFNYIHTMVRFALYRHGNLFSNVIAPHSLSAADKLVREGKVNELYEAQALSSRNTKLRLFEDLTTLATTAFEERELPVLQRIAYHDQVFNKEIDDMTNPRRLGTVPMMSMYIDRARELSTEELPAVYNPQQVFPARK